MKSILIVLSLIPTFLMAQDTVIVHTGVAYNQNFQGVYFGEPPAKAVEVRKAPPPKPVPVLAIRKKPKLIPPPPVYPPWRGLWHLWYYHCNCWNPEQIAEFDGQVKQASLYETLEEGLKWIRDGIKAGRIRSYCHHHTDPFRGYYEATPARITYINLPKK